MPPFLKRNLLILAIATATAAALFIPGPGNAMKEFGLVPWTVIVIFLCQGAVLNLSDNLQPGRHLKAIAWGLVITHILAPVFGWLVVRYGADHLGWQADDRVGFLLMCCMAPTLASGIIIAAQAGGDHLTSVLLTVAMNLASILTIPFNLKWTLGTESDIPIDQFALLRKLVLLILIPSLVGQLIRHFRAEDVKRHTPIIKIIPVLALSATIYMSLASQSDALRSIAPLRLLTYILPALTVHLSLFAVAYFGARWPLRLPEAVGRSLAICCSQKTLPVVVAIWSTSFHDYPTAILAPIVFHLSQIYCDGLIAKRLAARPTTPEPLPAG